MYWSCKQIEQLQHIASFDVPLSAAGMLASARGSNSQDDAFLFEDSKDEDEPKAKRSKTKEKSPKTMALSTVTEEAALALDRLLQSELGARLLHVRDV